MVHGRKNYVRELEEMEKAISGRGSNGRRRLNLRSEHKALADNLRARKVDLDKQKILGQLDERSWAEQTAALSKQIDSLARKIVPLYRQDLPRKHREI